MQDLAKDTHSELVRLPFAAAQMDAILKIVKSRLVSDDALPVVAFALNPAYQPFVSQQHRKLVLKWLGEHANLYGAEPATLRSEFMFYLSKDPESSFHPDADAWSITDAPARFWRLILLDDATPGLARVGRQFASFCCHTGDLERAHSQG